MKNPVLMVFNPAIVKVIEDKRNKKNSSSISKSPFLPLIFSWHYIHLANLLLSCTNISNHYFPSNLTQWIKIISSVTDNPFYWISYQDFALFHPLLLLLLLNPLLFLRLLFVPSIQTCRNPRNGSLFCFIFSFITKYKYLWQMKVGPHQLEFCISLQIFLTENQHFDYSSAPWWTFVSPCPSMYSIWPTKFSLTYILFIFLIILVTELEHLWKICQLFRGIYFYCVRKFTCAEWKYRHTFKGLNSGTRMWLGHGGHVNSFNFPYSWHRIDIDFGRAFPPLLDIM